MRTANAQFSWWSIEEARRICDRAPKMAENHGDRIAAERRVNGTPSPANYSAETWAELHAHARKHGKGALHSIERAPS